ncbi:MAG TPA: hypothetical protein PLZ56_15750, partial [Anaerolineae bacterium]|nr:hypothetical protein [Anaerolineae bacterium]
MKHRIALSFGHRRLQPARVLAIALVLGAGAWSPVSQTGAAAAQGVRPPEAYREVAVWPPQPLPRRGAEFSDVAGIATAGDRIYVVDPAEAHVEVLSMDGIARQRIGRPGTELGRLSAPRDVSVDGDRVYVADTGNRRIQVFDALSGGFLAAWPGLDRPVAVVARGETIWVAEARLGLLLQFDRAGRRVSSWGRGGEQELELSAPVGLAFGPDGDFYVAEMFTSAKALQAALGILRPYLLQSQVQSAGTVVIGTVKGDMHDIGKNLVTMMMEGAGFTVYDL